MVDPQSFQCEVAGKKLIIETGKLAGQASGAVTVRYGDTVLLVTVMVAEKPREGTDFLPLTIDYEERLYAAGKDGYKSLPQFDVELFLRLWDTLNLLPQLMANKNPFSHRDSEPQRIHRDF